MLPLHVLLPSCCRQPQCLMAPLQGLLRSPRSRTAPLLPPYEEESPVGVAILTAFLLVTAIAASSSRLTGVVPPCSRSAFTKACLVHRSVTADTATANTWARHRRACSVSGQAMQQHKAGQMMMN